MWWASSHPSRPHVTDKSLTSLLWHLDYHFNHCHSFAVLLIPYPFSFLSVVLVSFCTCDLNFSCLFPASLCEYINAMEERNYLFSLLYSKPHIGYSGTICYINKSKHTKDGEKSEKLENMEDWLRRCRLYVNRFPEIDLKNNAKEKIPKTQQDKFTHNKK